MKRRRRRPGLRTVALHPRTSRRSWLLIPFVGVLLRSAVLGCWRSPWRRKHGLGDELVKDFLSHDRHSLLSVGEQQQSVSWFDAEQVACALGEHALSLRPDLDCAGELPLRGGKTVYVHTHPPISHTFPTSITSSCPCR